MQQYCMVYDDLFLKMGEIWFEARSDAEAMYIALETCKELKKANGIEVEASWAFNLVKLANITTCKVIFDKKN